MKIKTNELKDQALDWAVAVTKNVFSQDRHVEGDDGTTYRPSSNWSQGGPIIEREKITVSSQTNGHDWAAKAAHNYSYGPTPLIAAMRCYCCSKLGDEVEVPDELA